MNSMQAAKTLSTERSARSGSVSTWTSLPRGAHRRGSEARENKTTTGFPPAAATCVAPVSLPIGMRVGTAPHDPGPFRHSPRPEQPGKHAGPVRGLKIVDPVEAAAPQHPAERNPATEIERLWTPVDQNIVEQSRLRGQL